MSLHAVAEARFADVDGFVIAGDEPDFRGALRGILERNRDRSPTASVVGESACGGPFEAAFAALHAGPASCRIARCEAAFRSTERDFVAAA